MGERHASYLSQLQLFHLDQACSVIRQAFGHRGGPYLVGSAQTRPDFRDVDVRLILDDEDFDALDSMVRIFINLTTSAWLSQRTGLPIDFQIQQQTAANANHPGRRNPLGGRSLQNFSGDWDAARPTEEAEK
jgi:hypothetical protein